MKTFIIAITLFAILDAIFMYGLIIITSNKDKNNPKSKIKKTKTSNQRTDKFRSITLITTITSLILTGCSNSNYANAGNEREVSSDTESESVTEEKLYPITISEMFENKPCIYSGDIVFEKYYEDEEVYKSINLNVKLMTDADGDTMLTIERASDATQKDRYIMMSSNNFYMRVDNDNKENEPLEINDFDTDNTTDIFLMTLGYFNSMWDILTDSTYAAAINNEMIKVNEEENVLKIDFDRDSVINCVYDMWSEASSNYTEVFNATENDELFLSFVNKFYGDSYDISDGVPSNVWSSLCTQLATLTMSYVPENEFSGNVTFNNESDTPNIYVYLDYVDSDERETFVTGYLYQETNVEDFNVQISDYVTSDEYNSYLGDSSSESDSLPETESGE